MDSPFNSCFPSLEQENMLSLPPDHPKKTEKETQIDFTQKKIN